MGTQDYSLSKLKSVSYVMPVLNEEAHIRAAVRGIFDQNGMENVDCELIIALGPSTDGTAEEINRLKQDFPLKVVDNQLGKTATGLNLAITESNNDVIVRVDAHSVLSPNYTKLALDILNETGAANVGGIMKAEGKTAFQQAVAWAYRSRIGLGGGLFHVGGQAGPSDSVYLGVFRAEVLHRLGGFDEEMIRGQDWELNLRIRESGQIVWFDPRLQVTYFPRSQITALAKQFFDTGLWRAKLTKTHTSSANPRYFVPPSLVVALVVGLAMFCLGVGGLIGLTPLLVYTAFLLVSCFLAKNLGWKSKVSLLAALPIMHLSWGSGFLTGLFTKR